MTNGLRHFLLALQFFTRIPVTGRLAQWVGYSPAMLRAAVAHFPGVGWVVGGAAAGVWLAARAGLPGPLGALAAALLSTAATAWLTGAFHEDGLADTADGLGGAVSRERALEIMKDSRIGSYGTVALVLALGLKVALVALLGEQQGAVHAAAALVAAHALSRAAPLAIIRALPHVGDSATSKSKPLADAIGMSALALGFLWSIPAIALVFQWYGAIKSGASMLLLGLATWRLARLLRRRLGGFTGDGLGAAQQLGELAVYLALAWRLP